MLKRAERVNVIPDAPRVAVIGNPVPAVLALALLVALLLPGCASPRSPSEIEWEKAQCGAIIDREAREKCVERAGRK